MAPVAPRRSARIAALNKKAEANALAAKLAEKPAEKATPKKAAATPKTPKSTKAKTPRKSAVATKAKTPKKSAAATRTKTPKKSATAAKTKTPKKASKAAKDAVPDFSHLLVPVKIAKGLKERPAHGEEGFFCRGELGKALALMTVEGYGDQLTLNATELYEIAELDHTLNGLTNYAILAGVLEAAASMQSYAATIDGPGIYPVVKGGVRSCQVAGMYKTLGVVQKAAGLKLLPYGSVDIDSDAARFKQYFANKESKLYKCTKSGQLLQEEEILDVLRKHIKDWQYKPCVVTYTNDFLARYPDGIGEKKIGTACG